MSPHHHNQPAFAGVGNMQPPFHFDQASSEPEYGYDEKISHDKTQDIDVNNRSENDELDADEVDHFNEDISEIMDIANIGRPIKPAALRLSNSDFNMAPSPS